MKYNDIRRWTGKTAQEWAGELGITRQAVTRRYRLRPTPFEQVPQDTYTYQDRVGITREVVI